MIGIQKLCHLATLVQLVNGGGREEEEAGSAPTVTKKISTGQWELQQLSEYQKGRESARGISAFQALSTASGQPCSGTSLGWGLKEKEQSQAGKGW